MCWWCLTSDSVYKYTALSALPPQSFGRYYSSCSLTKLNKNQYRVSLKLITSKGFACRKSTSYNKLVPIVNIMNIAQFWSSFNLFKFDFGHIHPYVQCKLFKQHCCSFYGAPLWLLSSQGVSDACIAWRKAL